VGRTTLVMSILCICVDDEPLARQGVKLALAPYTDFELIGEFSSADEVLSSSINSTSINNTSINKTSINSISINNSSANIASIDNSDLNSSDLSHIDVIFLDIEMPRMNGFSMLQKWQGTLPLVVFITAYDQYAIQAFEQQALDYVLKPIDEARFANVIDRIRMQLSQDSKALASETMLKTIENLKTQIVDKGKNISVKTDEGYFRINAGEINYLESVGDHVCIHLQDKQLITRQTLKYFAAELCDFGFYQVHKSYLVNAQHIRQTKKLRFSDYELVLSNGDTIRLSRRYKSVLNSLID
jgi:two-component system, LytTR family, response regulator